MRWDNLFDDLEGQLEQGIGAEETDLRAEEERLRLGRLSLRDRLSSLLESGERSSTATVLVTLLNGMTIPLRPHTIGRDWVSGDLIDGSVRRSQCILPIPAIGDLVFSREQVLASLGDPGESGGGSGLARRLGLAFMLRDLCRRRCAVEFTLGDGTLSGTIDRVGRDHFDVAVHEAGSARRESEVLQYRIVPFSRLLLVRV
jgi:hypothetical protein